MPQDTTANNFTAVSHSPWADREQLMAAPSTPQQCIAPTGAHFVSDFSTAGLHWQRLWHAVLYEALRGLCPLSWSRQELGVAVACLYPLLSTSKHCSLLGDPNNTHLSKARSAACISAQEQAKPACSRILQGPTPKCLSSLSWVQASSAQHSSAVRGAPERVSIQCSQRA